MDRSTDETIRQFLLQLRRIAYAVEALVKNKYSYVGMECRDCDCSLIEVPEDNSPVFCPSCGLAMENPRGKY